MIIFLSELQKEHLNLLNSHSLQVLIDFCKLAIDYLNNGANATKYDIAAEKLGVSSSVIQNLVHAIVYLLVEGSKYNLSEQDFKSSLSLCGFSPERQAVLARLLAARRAELAAGLRLLRPRQQHYQDLAWRLDVDVASRSGREDMKPKVTMDFVLNTPKSYQDKETKTEHDGSTYDRQINNSIQDAKTANECQSVIKHKLVRCDLPTLLHVTNKLDAALKESKSQHVRKVQRGLQSL